MSFWTHLTVASHPSAFFPDAIALDSYRKVVVLVKGSNHTTWEYNGTNWTSITTAHHPSVDGAHPWAGSWTMCFDPIRNVIVLFGGFQSGGGGFVSNETWEYDGIDWIKRTLAHNPPARSVAPIIWDAAHNYVLLFGGDAGSILNDTWVYNGTDWTQLFPTTIPIGRWSGAFCFDYANNVSVYQGGTNPHISTIYHDVLIWNGTNWTILTPSTRPSASPSVNRATYSSNCRAIISYSNSETWAWTGSAYVQLFPTGSPSGSGVTALMLVNDPIDNRLLFGTDSVTDYNFQCQTLTYPVFKNVVRLP